MAFELLLPQANGTYRLMGVAISTLFDDEISEVADLRNDKAIKQEKLEKAIDQIRNKTGSNSIGGPRPYRKLALQAEMLKSYLIICKKNFQENLTRQVLRQ